MPYDEATVRIAVELRVRSNDGSDRWEWKACEIQPEAEDYVYTHSDLCAAIRGYAALASYAVPAGKYPAWRIVIRGRETGHMLAAYEWHWNAEKRKYTPAGAPWCWWPPVDVLPARVIKGALAHRERPFVPARMCGGAASCLMAGAGDAMRLTRRQPVLAA